jgi:hypothetical protein
MTRSSLSQDELAQLIEHEFARLARPGNLDLRVELEHHVWPFLQEIVAKLNDGVGEEAVLPAELAARVAALLAHLTQIAAKSVSVDEHQYLVAAAGETIDELLEYVDPDEWADLTRDFAVTQETAQATDSNIAPAPLAPESQTTPAEVAPPIPTVEVAS